MGHKAFHKLGEPISKPLILNTVPDAVPPSRISVNAW